MFSPPSSPTASPLPDGFGFPVWDDLFEPSFFFDLPSDLEPTALTPQSQTSTEPASSGEPVHTDEFSNSKTIAAGSVQAEVDERKRRRMASNRLSARRSRMRKQKHLENMRSLMNRLRFENRECANRVRLVAYHSRIVRTENELLLSEAAALRGRLGEIRRVLRFRQQLNSSAISLLPLNNFAAINNINGSGGQFKQHSLITQLING